MKEDMIGEWFMAWFDPTWEKFHDVFEDEVYYSESWGPEYNGIGDVRKWFSKWHLHSKLVSWEIKQFYHTENNTIVEWYFCSRDEKSSVGFDGCSIIEWGQNGKIHSLKEYSSSLPKYNPLNT